MKSISFTRECERTRAGGTRLARTYSPEIPKVSNLPDAKSPLFAKGRLDNLMKKFLFVVDPVAVLVWRPRGLFQHPADSRLSFWSPTKSPGLAVLQPPIHSTSFRRKPLPACNTSKQ